MATQIKGNSFLNEILTLENFPYNPFSNTYLEELKYLPEVPNVQNPNDYGYEHAHRPSFDDTIVCKDMSTPKKLTLLEEKEPFFKPLPCLYPKPSTIASVLRETPVISSPLRKLGLPNLDVYPSGTIGEFNLNNYQNPRTKSLFSNDLRAFNRQRSFVMMSLRVLEDLPILPEPFPPESSNQRYLNSISRSRKRVTKDEPRYRRSDHTSLMNDRIAFGMSVPYTKHPKKIQPTRRKRKYKSGSKGSSKTGESGSVGTGGVKTGSTESRSTETGSVSTDTSSTRSSESKSSKTGSSKSGSSKSALSNSTSSKSDSSKSGSSKSASSKFSSSKTHSTKSISSKSIFTKNSTENKLDPIEPLRNIHSNSPIQQNLAPPQLTNRLNGSINKKLEYIQNLSFSTHTRIKETMAYLHYKLKEIEPQEDETRIESFEFRIKQFELSDS